MNTTLKASGLAFILFIITTFAWYQGSREPHITFLNDSELALMPDHEATSLHIQQFDETGHLTHQFNANKMQHTPQNDQYSFKKPKADIKQSNQPPWRIQAQEAVATERGKTITFEHHVIIKHADFKTYEAGTIKTEKITYLPKEKKAYTKQHVTWVQPDKTVESQGMIVDLDKHQIDLLNEAKATYVPKKP